MSEFGSPHSSISDTLARLTAASQHVVASFERSGPAVMATAYLAEDLRHHRNVAVKVLRDELALPTTKDRSVWPTAGGITAIAALIGDTAAERRPPRLRTCPVVP